MNMGFEDVNRSKQRRSDKNIKCFDKTGSLIETTHNRIPIKITEKTKKRWNGTK